MAGVLFVLGSNTTCPGRRLLRHQDLATGVVVWGGSAVAETCSSDRFVWCLFVLDGVPSAGVVRG